MMDTALTFVVILIGVLLSSVDAEEPPTQGHWGSWGPLSPCSVTCGSGTASMERVWIPGPNDPPQKVPFTSTQVYSCTDETYPECPQNGTWSGWGAWSGCTKACGGGMRERHRECRGQMYGGRPCEGDKFSKEDCNREPCPPLPKNFDMSQCKEDSNFTCSNNLMCILIDEKCDNKVQCNDGSDEENCSNIRFMWRENVRYDLKKSAGSLFPVISFGFVAPLAVTTYIIVLL